MRQIPATVLSQSLEPLGTPVPIVQLSQQTSTQPGQFYLAFHHDDQVASRSRLFPINISNDVLRFDQVPNPSWLPGQTVDLLGPLGNGFTPPTESRRWLLLSFGDHPERLYPLLDMGRERSASFAFWAHRPLSELPADIERPVTPAEGLTWADFIAIELTGHNWPANYEDLYKPLTDRLLSTVQALIDIPTPCGIGGCLGCVLPGTKEVRLACQQGLVRDFGEIGG